MNQKVNIDSCSSYLTYVTCFVQFHCVVSECSLVVGYRQDFKIASLFFHFRHEIHEVRKLSFLRAGFMSFFFSSASLVSFVTMMTYVLAGNRLTAQKVFTCVSLFNGSRLVMTLFFPIAVTLLNEGRVSLERMEVGRHLKKPLNIEIVGDLHH